jgi:hypothetical protein
LLFKKKFFCKALIPFIGVRLLQLLSVQLAKPGQPPMGPGTVPVLLASVLKVAPFWSVPDSHRFPELFLIDLIAWHIPWYLSTKEEAEL